MPLSGTTGNDQLPVLRIWIKYFIHVWEALVAGKVVAAPAMSGLARRPTEAEVFILNRRKWLVHDEMTRPILYGMRCCKAVSIAGSNPHHGIVIDTH